MEVDNDIDSQLMTALRSMGTTDKEVLVREFMQILQPSRDISPKAAEFFLDMNNWNIQNALCSFYDYEKTAITDSNLPQMTFVKDVTIGEGESVPPNTRFLKSWRLRNSGNVDWPSGCALHRVEGESLSGHDCVYASPISPGGETDLCIEMISPNHPGVFQSAWRMMTSQGAPFGEPVWCIIHVEEGGLLGVTQQLASTSCNDPGTLPSAEDADEIPSLETVDVEPHSLWGRHSDFLGLAAPSTSQWLAAYDGRGVLTGAALFEHSIDSSLPTQRSSLSAATMQQQQWEQRDVDAGISAIPSAVSSTFQLVEQQKTAQTTATVPAGSIVMYSDSVNAEAGCSQNRNDPRLLS